MAHARFNGLDAGQRGQRIGGNLGARFEGWSQWLGVGPLAPGSPEPLEAATRESGTDAGDERPSLRSISRQRRDDDPWHRLDERGCHGFRDDLSEFPRFGEQRGLGSIAGPLQWHHRGRLPGRVSRSGAGATIGRRIRQDAPVAPRRRARFSCGRPRTKRVLGEACTLPERHS